MRLTRALFACACCGLAASAAFAQQARPATLSPAAYAATLTQLADDVTKMDEAQPDSVTATLAALPPVWHVQLGDRTLDVSTDWLRHDLLAWQKHPDAGDRTRLAEHLRLVSAEAAPAALPAAGQTGAHAALDGILAQREFQNVRGASWLDQLLERILRWLFGVLGAAVTSSTMSIVTTVLVYGLIGAAVSLVTIMIYRAMREGSTIAPLHLESGPQPLGPVSLDDVRAAAERGDWREAVHLAYWSGIHELETRGTWRPDRARTPREYLRLLPPASALAQPLKALTQLIERIWYAGEPADASGFNDAMAHLRQLGCLHL